MTDTSLSKTDGTRTQASSLAARANAQIAARLEEAARLLAEQKANPYRVDAYRRAARTIRGSPTSIAAAAVEQGIDGLMRIPGIGESLARSIQQIVTTGRLPMLDRLRGEADPLAMLTSVVGIGHKTARRIHDELGIQTLEELEMAAHDGRLERLRLGEKRIAGIRDALAGRLGRVNRGERTEDGPPPDVAEILDVDQQYRSEAAQCTLPTIAPRRFNPAHEAWLPVLHTTRGERHYTALFSNTARAHELGRTRDWVVVYFDGRASERQYTIVTAQSGPLRGLRVVRGREEECMRHYAGAQLTAH